MLVVCAVLALGQFLHVPEAQAAPQEAPCIKTQAIESHTEHNHHGKKAGAFCCESCHHVQLMAVPVTPQAPLMYSEESITAVPVQIRNATRDTLSKPPRA